MDSEWKDYLSPLSMRYNNIFVAGLDETEMISYDYPKDWLGLALPK